MQRLFVLVIFLLMQSTVTAQENNNYKTDFEFFWTTIKKDYAYWNNKSTDWEKVRSHYAPIVDTVSSHGSFILVLEKVFNELYDHHASLNSNTKQSQRLIPSGTDIWAEYVNGKPMITQVRSGFGASAAGLKAGMEIISFNDVAVEEAIKEFLPVSLTKPDAAAKDYALRVLLAGKFIADRKITVRDGSSLKTFFPDRPVSLLVKHQYNGEIESKIFDGRIGYIKINNRLWDNHLILVFDSVLQSLRNTKSLILDLRETPGGGNTTVARAIMGSFIDKEGFFQKHELTSEENRFGIKRSWVEIVSPRKYVYTKPLVVLCDHWTGSVGEGITIGFDALKRATIIGTKMAGLNGANYSYTMPYSKIGFSFPAEKLYHVNGSPREKFIPAIVVDVRKEKDRADIILQKALNYLKRK